MEKNRISIIVPCWNEEESLQFFYPTIEKVMNLMNNDFELLFIDDGSTDKTLKILKKLSKQDKRVKFISFSRNFGKEAAILAGLKNTTGDYVAIMDADLQDPPEKLIEMYDIIIKENLDVVGLKTSNYENYSFLRKMFTSIYYKILSIFTMIPMKPNERDYRLMTRQVVDAILEFKEYNRYSKGIFNFVGFNTKWLDYEPQNRIAGESKWNLRHLFAYGIDGIVGFSTKPLLLSFVVGIFFCFLSFILLFIIIFKMLIYKTIISWFIVINVIIFVSGIELIFLGIIGEYLAKIYFETKNRPIYIIKETNTNLRKY